MITVTYSSSGRNKDQKLVGSFRRSDLAVGHAIIALPLKMYSKFGQPEEILVGHMLKLVRK